MRQTSEERSEIDTNSWVFVVSKKRHLKLGKHGLFNKWCMVNQGAIWKNKARPPSFTHTQSESKF